MIEFNADVKPIYEAMGIIDGITAGIESDVYVDAILNASINELREQFHVVFTATSLSNPQKYHHVWEWGGIGSNPLYFLTKSGKGKQKSVSFSFRQSLKAVPKPDAGATGIPQENIDRLKRRSIFRFKAIIMETGTAVHITPKAAKTLFVPTPGAENKDGDEVNFVFRKSVTLRNVGGAEATGAFGMFWTAFWTMEAPEIMDQRVLPRIEAEIGAATNNQLRTVRRGSTSKYKEFTVVPVGALQAAHRARAEAAEREITTYAQTFEQEEDWDEEE